MYFIRGRNFVRKFTSESLDAKLRRYHEFAPAGYPKWLFLVARGGFKDFSLARRPTNIYIYI